MFDSILNKYRSIEFAKSNGRIDALDLYRFIAIVLMIQGHTIYAFAAPNYIDLNNFWWSLWTFVRGLTAPVFMMISGTVNVFATKRLPNGLIDNNKILKRIRTAAVLLFVAYMVSFPATSLRHLDSLSDKYWTQFLQTNILHITAVSLLILQVFYKIAKDDKQLSLFTFTFAIFSVFAPQFTQYVDWYSVLPQFLAPYFSNEKGAIYTLFPICSYFFFGVSIGIFLKNTPKDKLFEYIFKKGLILGIILMIIGIPAFNYINSLRYEGLITSQTNPAGIVMRLGIVISLFPIVIILNEKIKRFSFLYLTLSKKSFFLFVVHLLIIYGCAIFPGFNYIWSNKLMGLQLFLSALIVEILSLSIAWYYDKTVKFLPSIRYAYLSIIIIYALMINLTY